MSLNAEADLCYRCSHDHVIVCLAYSNVHFARIKTYHLANDDFFRLSFWKYFIFCWQIFRFRMLSWRSVRQSDQGDDLAHFMMYWTAILLLQIEHYVLFFIFWPNEIMSNVCVINKTNSISTSFITFTIAVTLCTVWGLSTEKECCHCQPQAFTQWKMD